MNVFEFMDVDVSSSENSTKPAIIYRPPPSKKNKRSYADCLVEFIGFIEHYAIMTTCFASVVDFNIHWDTPSNNNVKRFTDLLEALNIIQHVHAPTHVDGHTIDLILTPSANHGITSTKTALLLSDHLWMEYVIDLYTDDIQLYIKFAMTELNRLLSLRRIEHCINDVRGWMVDNQLKVNDDKTVAFVLSSRNNRANHNITVIKIGDCDITPSPTSKNIGFIFDTEMSMVSHVKHVCCISYYHLRNNASMRSCLTQKAAVRLVYFLVISKTDYSNCLLYDLPDCLISKLHRVQNAAARQVVRCHRWEHITPVLLKLHWLPVKQRVQYSILLLQ